MRLTILLLLLATMAYSQPFPVADLEFEVQHADISVVDIDSDGDLDLLITGESPGGLKLVQLFENDGTGQFEAIDSPFDSLSLATIDWGDINGDGYLDLVMSGFSNAAPTALLYTSDSTGTFTRDTTVMLPQLAPSIGIADLDNDGYADIYVFGNVFEGKPVLFYNDQEGGFTQSSQFTAFEWIDPQVTEVDYDNDGDIDLFINGFDELNKNRYSRMFVNENGMFTEQDLGLIPKGYGSATWGDYDADGDLDLLLNGDGGWASGENSDDVYRLYRNDEGDFTEVDTFTTYRQISVGDGSRFADWDNDGDLDIILTGWNNLAGRQATAIFLNNAGAFTLMNGSEQLPGVSESSIEVGDLDGDGDLDLILTGFSGNDYNGEGSALNRRVSLIVWNPTTNVNEAPEAPQNLTAMMSDSIVTLSWEAPDDDRTAMESLSYNLYLIDGQGNYIIYPLADTATGFRRVSQLGNVQLNTSWTLRNLPQGAYTWGVQAIDNSYTGSEFAVGRFNFQTTSLRQIQAELKSIAFPNPTGGQLNIPVEYQNSQLIITSMEGKLMRSLLAQQNLNIDLPKGIYILRFTTPKGEVAIQRLVVQ